jgi:hypothetical protein
VFRGAEGEGRNEVGDDDDSDNEERCLRRAVDEEGVEAVRFITMRQN